MWLKRKDVMYNLDHFETMRLDYEYESNRHYFLLISATHENRDHESKIGPFTQAKAREYFNAVIAAMQNGDTIWEFPEETEAQ